MTTSSFINKDKNLNPKQSPSEKYTLVKNYFERVNAEYRLTQIMGNHKTSEIIKNIQQRNKIKWNEWIEAFIKSPKAGVTWVKTRASEEFNNAISAIWNTKLSQNIFNNRFTQICKEWINHTVRLISPIDTIRDYIFRGISSPYHITQKLVNQLNTNPIFKNILQNSTTEKRGQIAKDLLTLHLFLKNNPDISASASITDSRDIAYWSMLLDKVKISQNKNEIIKICLGIEPLEKILVNEELEPSEKNIHIENEITIPETNTEEYISLSEFIERRIYHFKMIFKNIQKHNDFASFKILYASLAYLKREYITEILSKNSTIGTNISKTLNSMSKSTFKYGLQNPVSISVVSSAMIALITITKEKGLNYIVPKNPDSFRIWLQSELQNNNEWKNFLQSLPEETIHNLHLISEYASGLKEFPELPANQIQVFFTSM